MNGEAYNRVLRFPLRSSILYGHKGYYAELGLNYVWGFRWYNVSSYNEASMVTEHYLLPSIGLRIQDLERRALFFRFNIYPVNELTINSSFLSEWPFNRKIPTIANKFVPWIGISAGYTFRSKHIMSLKNNKN